MTSPQPFTIIPFTNLDDLPEPDRGPYIVAAKDGYFVHRTFHFGRVLVPTKEAPLTPDARPTLWHTIDPKLPASLVGQAYSFFKAVYEAKKSEAMVDITWTPERGYRLFVPPQTATGGGVKCTRTPEHYQGQIVGTIHSHCDFNAFHSGTDTHDADSHDGLHITIGDVMKAKPSVALMISVAGARWNFEFDEVVDGPLALHSHPEWWERYVTEPAKTTYTSSYKPTTKPTVMPGAIQGPTKQNPVVVSKPPAGWNDNYDLDALLWRYQGLYNPDEEAVITEAGAMIDLIRGELEKIGIEMDPSYTVTDFNRGNNPNFFGDH